MSCLAYTLEDLMQSSREYSTVCCIFGLGLSLFRLSVCRTLICAVAMRHRRSKYQVKSFSTTAQHRKTATPS